MSDDRKRGLASLIHVLGGLPRRGCAYLVYGRPVIGKSSLGLEMLCELGLSGIRGHFISSEQPLSGLARLANGRNLPAEPQLILQSVTSSQGVASAIDEGKCAVCVVDSINELNGGTGTPGIALTLSRLAVSRDVIIFATAHTNHAGGLMGGDRLRKHFAQTIRLRALGDDADPHRILETETTPRRRALFKMHEGRMLDCGPLPNEEA